MNQLLKKEIRSLMPAWIVATLLALAPLLPVPALAPPAFALGWILLGLAPFGQEFSAGTFSLLLAQPVSRQRIWRAKILALAGAFAAVLAVFLVCSKIRWWLAAGEATNNVSMPENLWGGILIALFALVALTGGLWTTLLFHQLAAAFWLTFLIPALISISVALLAERYSIALHTSRLAGLAVLYSAAGFFGARRLLLRAQDTQWTGGTLSLPDLARARSQPAPAAGRLHRPFRALMRKELQSHSASLYLAGMVLIFHCLALWGQKLTYDPTAPNRALHLALGFFGFVWMAFPLLIGSSAVAEERKQGTWESFLCLPATRRSRLAAKLLSALALGIVLGGVAPWTVERIGLALGNRDSVLRDPEDYAQALFFLCLMAGGVALLSFYASTCARNLLQALGFAVASNLISFQVGRWVIAEAFGESRKPPFWSGPLVFYIGIPVLLAVWPALVRWNFSQLQADWKLWRRNLLTWLGTFAFIGTATVLVWNRTWEWVMPLEQPHGPPRLHGPVSPQICVSGVRRFVLLPDGRLWVTRNFHWRELYETYQVKNGKLESEKFQVRVPLDGEFLGGSNWTDIAGSYFQVAGIQSDGSLWSLLEKHGTNAPQLKLERIGTDADWKRIAGGGAGFLALKRDGTLWGWGSNFYGQLGPGPKAFTNGPVRIGRDKDWARVFLSEPGTSIGVKCDGTVWRWGWRGGHMHLRDSGRNWQEHPEPERWDLDGNDWSQFWEGYFGECGLKKDGTVWFFGPRFSDRVVLSSRQTVPAGQTVQFGSDSDWAQISGERLWFAGRKTNGTLAEFNFWSRHLLWPRVWNPSRYSDWLVVSVNNVGEINDLNEIMALAADGTLTGWEDPVRPPSRHSLLGPSRRPFWTLNVLANSK